MPLGPHGLEERPDEVLAVGRTGGLVIRELGVPQAEPVVVFRGHDEVLHAGRLGGPGPLFGVVKIGIEALEVAGIGLVGHALAALDPFVAGGQGVEPPVDEHAEAGLGPPLHPGFLLGRGLGLGRGGRGRGRQPEQADAGEECSQHGGLLSAKTPPYLAYDREKCKPEERVSGKRRSCPRRYGPSGRIRLRGPGRRTRARPRRPRGRRDRGPSGPRRRPGRASAGGPG